MNEHIGGYIQFYAHLEVTHCCICGKKLRGSIKSPSIHFGYYRIGEVAVSAGFCFNKGDDTPCYKKAKKLRHRENCLGKWKPKFGITGKNYHIIRGGIQRFERKHKNRN